MAVVAGVDGCRGGWVMATLRGPAGECDGEGDRQQRDGRSHGLRIEVIDSLSVITHALASGQLAAAGIDIPIGLPAPGHGPRHCDMATRRLLGPRRNSVFPAPLRAVLAAESYEEACAISRAESGKAISKQLFNIVPKIREADEALGALTAPQHDQLFEMCPELSFAILGGAPMRANKRTAAGQGERLTALRSARDVLGDLAELGEVAALASPITRAPAGAAADDVLDAVVGAWTAWRYLGGTHTQLGGERDERGLPMRVVA